VALLRRSVPAAAPWAPTVDLNHAPRVAPPALGAIERDSGPLPAQWRP
jgi:hypothetical protein